MTNKSSNDKMMQQVEKAQAVSEVKMDELTREVRKHNNFAERIPTLEQQMKTVSRDVEDLKKTVSSL